MYRILFSNIGYARGIDGTIRSHIDNFGRHFYCDAPAQMRILGQIKEVIDRESPDLCCFVEIDQGSHQTAGLNQIEGLLDSHYRYHDIADKYGDRNRLSRMPLHRGKSNAFLSRQDVGFRRLYFKKGNKRLIYRLALPEGIDLYFAHFSLWGPTRKAQLQQVRDMIEKRGRDSIVLADFNIMKGFGELAPLMENGGLHLFNREEEHTFTFHKTRKTLDLCLCSQTLAEKARLKLIPQPFSDHAALLLELKT